jgi:hypothetical protein
MTENKAERCVRVEFHVIVGEDPTLEIEGGANPQRIEAMTDGEVREHVKSAFASIINSAPENVSAMNELFDGENHLLVFKSVSLVNTGANPAAPASGQLKGHMIAHCSSRTSGWILGANEKAPIRFYGCGRVEDDFLLEHDRPSNVREYLTQHELQAVLFGARRGLPVS